MPVTLVTHWRTSSRSQLACGCVCPQDAGTCSAQSQPFIATSVAEEYLECDMAAAGLRGGVVLASVVLFLVHPLLDAADGGGG